MKIGSHSGLLSRLIDILSAKAALVWKQEEPPTDVLAGSLGPGLGAALVATAHRSPQAGRKVPGLFQWPVGLLVSARLTQT